MPKQDALSDQEVEELINACRTDFERFVVVMLVFTGMRVDELAHLKKYWINFDVDIITVPEKDVEWKPKTKAGARPIPIIEPRLKFEIEKYFKNNMAVGKSRYTLWRMVRKIAKRTSIKRVYPHALRSTFASMLIYKGISEGTLCTIMGWSDIKTAQEYFKLSGQKAIEELKRKW